MWNAWDGIAQELQNLQLMMKKYMNRELIRLRISLDEAVKNGYNKFIVMLHYPPTNDKFEETRTYKNSKRI